MAAAGLSRSNGAASLRSLPRVLALTAFSMNNTTRSKSGNLGRRQFIAQSATAAAAAAGSSLLAAQPASPRRDSIIARENAREGARDWQLTRVRIDTPKGGTMREAIRSSVIEGYCSRQSVTAGETIEFMLSPKRDLIAAKLFLLRDDSAALMVQFGEFVDPRRIFAPRFQRTARRPVRRW